MNALTMRGYPGAKADRRAARLASSERRIETTSQFDRDMAAIWARYDIHADAVQRDLERVTLATPDGLVTVEKVSLA